MRISKLNKNWLNEKGTALLTAMLIMGVLITISIALSSLVMREVRVTRDLIDAGKAFYAAESGVEEALYFLNNKLPGWQTVEGKFEEGKTSDDVIFKYVVKNQCNSYPCIDEEEYELSGGVGDVSVPTAEAFYDVMDLNESVLIPLFVIDEDGTIQSVRDFTVEFYGNFNPFEDLKGIKDVSPLSGWDVLRWKVFGMKNMGVVEGYSTESISDFMPLAKTSGGDVADAETPSWFGTVSCSDPRVLDRITTGIECKQYGVFTYDSSLQKGECNNASLWARDYYGEEGGKIENQGCKNIGDFVEDRQSSDSPVGIGPTGLNYLSLTNIVNPAMFKDEYVNKEDLAKLYFRVETYEDNTVREVAEIFSDGYAGNSKQSIKVMKKRDSYMPVFNFSIYSTYGSEGKDEGGDDYYYYDNDPKLVLPGN